MSPGMMPPVTASNSLSARSFEVSLVLLMILSVLLQVTGGKRTWM
jgi:hypothetical protein